MSKKDKETKVLSRQEREARDEQQKKIAKRVSWGVGVAITALIAVAIIIVAYGKIVPAVKRMGTYFSIGDYKIKAEEYDYYYNSAFNTFYEQYGSYVSYLGLDLTQSLSDQIYDGELTWDDYFMESAVESMKQVYALYDAAQSDQDFSVDADALVDEYMQQVEANAAASGVGLEEYIQTSFGSDLNEKKFRQIVERQLIAGEYAEYLEDGQEVSDEEIQEKYEGNSSYYMADYQSFTFSCEYETDATDEEKEAVQEEVKKKAEEMMGKITDQASFHELVLTYCEDDDREDYEEEDSVLFQDTVVANISDTDVAEWLMEEDREAGDVEVLEGTDKYTVVYFIDCDLIDSSTTSFRHILVSNSSLNDADAQGNAEKILAFWKENGADEDLFEEMAIRYTDDSGSVSTGGLYEFCYRGQMVEPITEWLFDEDRKAGDTEIVASDYGYHVMYFVGSDDEAYYLSGARQEVKYEKAEAQITEMTDAMKITDKKKVLTYLDRKSESELSATSTDAE